MRRRCASKSQRAPVHRRARHRVRVAEDRRQQRLLPGVVAGVSARAGDSSREAQAPVSVVEHRLARRPHLESARLDTADVADGAHPMDRCRTSPEGGLGRIVATADVLEHDVHRDAVTDVRHDAIELFDAGVRAWAVRMEPHDERRASRHRRDRAGLGPTRRWRSRLSSGHLIAPERRQPGSDDRHPSAEEQHEAEPAASDSERGRMHTAHVARQHDVCHGCATQVSRQGCPTCPKAVNYLPTDVRIAMDDRHDCAGDLDISSHAG